MLEFLKAIARGLAFIIVLPVLLSYFLRSRILGRDRALEGSTQWLALIPGLPGQYLRRAFLARVLSGCAASAVVGFGTIFSKSGARLDARSYVGPGCFLGLVHIEADVLVGAGVHITSGRQTHGISDVTVPIREQAARAGARPYWRRRLDRKRSRHHGRRRKELRRRRRFGRDAFDSRLGRRGWRAGPHSASEDEWVNVQRLRRRARVRLLFLTHRLPYAPNRGDRIRAFHLLRHLSTWAEVHLLSLVHDADEASRAAAVPGAASVTVVPVPRLRNLARGLLSLPTDRPLTHVMLDSPALVSRVRALARAHPPAVVLAYCSGMARLALDPPLDGIPFVVDMVDVDSAKWAALSSTARLPLSWIYAREGRLLARFEARAARLASATLVVTPKERDTLAALAPGARIAVVPNGIDADSLSPPGPPTDGPVVVFCGVMNYTPNVDAAIWLVRKVWPLVRESRPDARLQIVGDSPVAAVRELADEAQAIDVTGRVEDIRPYLWGAAVSVAPLQVARGVQNKVLEAIAAGLPVVITPIVREGLPVEALAACVEAVDPPGFARAILDLLAEPAADRRARARAADLTVLSWERRLAPIRGLLEEAAGSRR